jgi:hypothetical protein
MSYVQPIITATGLIKLNWDIVRENLPFADSNQNLGSLISNVNFNNIVFVNNYDKLMIFQFVYENNENISVEEVRDLWDYRLFLPCENDNPPSQFDNGSLYKMSAMYSIIIKCETGSVDFWIQGNYQEYDSNPFLYLYNYIPQTKRIKIYEGGSFMWTMPENTARNWIYDNAQIVFNMATNSKISVIVVGSGEIIEC